MHDIYYYEEQLTKLGKVDPNMEVPLTVGILIKLMTIVVVSMKMIKADIMPIEYIKELSMHMDD